MLNKKIIIFLERYNSIAFHCKAGLGRAPLILAICFIILFDYNSNDIIEKIRKEQPDAFNNVQLKYLFNFRKHKYVDSKCIIS